MMLTVEEMTMMKAFDRSARGVAIADLTAGIAAAEDPELKTACKALEEKLSKMTDAEFAAIDFTIYDEELTDAG